MHEWLWRGMHACGCERLRVSRMRYGLSPRACECEHWCASATWRVCDAGVRLSGWFAVNVRTYELACEVGIILMFLLVMISVFVLACVCGYCDVINAYRPTPQ